MISEKNIEINYIIINHYNKTNNKDIIKKYYEKKGCKYD